MAYNLYPAVDENFNFPPEIRDALIASLNIRNLGAPMDTDERNALPTQDLGYGYYIYNLDWDRFEIYRPEFDKWHVGLEAPGSIKEWPSDVIPEGWMKQNGRELDRIVYGALYKVIGTKYGAGNNSTTYNIPNRQARVTLDVGGEYELGEQGGVAKVKLTEAQMPSHTHSGSADSRNYTHRHAGGTTSDGTHEHDYVRPALGDKAELQGTSVIYRNQAGATTSGGGNHGHFISTDELSWDHSHTITIGSKGGTEDHENMMPFHASHLLIKF